MEVLIWGLLSIGALMALFVTVQLIRIICIAFYELVRALVLYILKKEDRRALNQLDKDIEERIKTGKIN